MIFQALLGISLQQTMVIEDNCDNNNGMASGWPLGLANMNMMRLIASAGQPHYSSTQRRPSLHSFPSFSSSSLDTQSTASFFPDRSVSLGRLMGINPAENRGRFSNTNSTRFDQNYVVPHSLSFGRAQDDGKGPSQTHCVPLIQNVIEKLTRSKSTLITH